jgi:hypothetical protein
MATKSFFLMVTNHPFWWKLIDLASGHQIVPFGGCRIVLSCGHQVHLSIAHDVNIDEGHQMLNMWQLK